MRRLLALLAAAGMVVAALAVRGGLDGDGGDGGDGGSGNGEIARLVCATELASVCEGLASEVVIEDPGRTVDRLGDARASDLPDAWLTFAPWPDVLAFRRQAGGEPAFGRGTTLARARLAALAPADLDCDEWRCLGDHLAEPNRRLGWTGATSGPGPVVLGALAAGQLGRVEFATNDLEAQPPVLERLAGVLEEAETQANPTRIRLVSPLVDVAVDHEHMVKAEYDDAAPRNRQRVRLLYPEPVVALEVVLAARPGADTPDDRLAERLAERGWSRDARGTSLRPGVLVALMEELGL